MEVVYREVRQRQGGLVIRPTATVLLVIAGLVTAAMPFDRAVGFDVQFLRSPSAVLALLLVVLFLWRTRGHVRLTDRSQLWAIAFVVTLGVLELARLALADAHAYTGAPSLTVVAARYMSWAQPIILFLIISVIAKDRRSVAFILQGFPLVMGTLALGAITVAGSGRWAPLGLNENAAGIAFGVALIIATAVLLRPWPRTAPLSMIAYAVCVPLNLIGLLATGSRGASAATLVALATLLILTPMNLRRLLVLAAALIVLTAASGAYLQSASSLLVNRWQSALDGTQLGVRDELLVVSYSLFTESPVWGYGLQANRLVGEQYSAARGGSTAFSFSPHNTLFSLLLPFGVVGAFPWFAMVLAVAMRAWKHRRHPNAPMLLALLMLFFSYTLGANIVGNILFYVVLGLSAGLPHWAGAHVTESPSVRPRNRLVPPER